MGYKKYAKTQGDLMIKFLNANSKNSVKKLEIFLSKRKINQFSQSSYIKKILYNVKNQGDKAVINYDL